MSPFEGRCEYGLIWKGIVKQLFHDQPWDFEKHGTTKGSHGFVETTVAADLIVLLDSLSSKDCPRIVPLRALVDRFTEGSLDLHGLKAKDLSKRRLHGEETRHRNYLKDKIDMLKDFGIASHADGIVTLSKRGGEFAEALTSSKPDSEKGENP